MADVVGPALVENDGPGVFCVTLASCCGGFVSDSVKVPMVVLNASDLGFVPSQVGFDPRRLV